MNYEEVAKKIGEESSESISPKDLQEMKKWLFSEYTKVQNLKAEQQRVYEKFLQERKTFMEDMRAINERVLRERRRLKEEEAFFDKKLQILQNGYMSLDLDRRKFEREKREFEQIRKKRFERRDERGDRGSGLCSEYSRYEVSLFFAGVKEPLALRKRYKDLLKIFHPDNRDGDEGIVKAINKEYERLKKVLAF